MFFRFIKSFRNRHVMAVDLVLILIVVNLAFLTRFEQSYLYYKFIPVMRRMMAVSLVIKPIIYWSFGLYSRLWSHAGIQEGLLVAIAVFVASGVVGIIMILMNWMNFLVGFPRSVIAIDALLSLIAVGGIRYLIRVAHDNEQQRDFVNRKFHRKGVIIGAGDAGVMVLNEILRNPQLGITPVCFVDDDAKKRKLMIRSIRVEGTIVDLPRIIEKNRITDCIFAIPSAPASIVRAVADVCHERKVSFMIMPGIYNILNGTVAVSKIREIDITDLLRRDPVKLDERNIRSVIVDQVVLVTGGGGSIGRELCFQVAAYRPKALVLLGHGENSIFEAVNDLHDRYPQLNVVGKIADIRDAGRLDAIFSELKPDVVFHAAAHKHVPLMEQNIVEAVTNNIFGTRNVVRTASAHGVRRFVMISTDKAVRPANIMGASKRIAENIVLNESRFSDATFTAVRFGNVLGSRGSVVTIFKRQIANGGPVTVTHPEIERYFMTIPEAVYLVLESAGLARSRETFVLNMGTQVRVFTLAEDLIKLSGLEVGKDIEIVFTRMRPGEKLREDLWNEGQTLDPTIHPDIFKLQRDDLLPPEEIDEALRRLAELVEANDSEGIRAYLNQVIPDANLERSEIPDEEADGAPATPPLSALKKSGTAGEEKTGAENGRKPLFFSARKSNRKQNRKTGNAAHG